MTRFTACGYDASENGLRLVHRMYLHPGSTCICWLPDKDKGLVPHGGTLTWCHYFQGMIHGSGVVLDKPIRVGDYAD